MERRSFLRGCVVVGATGAACSTGLLASGAAIANGSDPFEATSLDAVLKALGADDAQTSNQIKITAPKVAENGASVPVAISSTIQGTTEIMTIVSTNPKPLAARNRFGKGAAPSVSSTAVPLMRTSVKMLSEVAVDQPSICAAAEQAGAAGTGSFAVI